MDFDSSTVSKPSATTETVTNLLGDGATLVGSVNPNGGASTVWFEWGSTSALGNVTPQQSIPSGSNPVTATATISSLASNTTYYYRIDATNSAGKSTGNILSFTTLSVLPPPVLLTPPNGSANISTAPTFTWTSVPNATSYRLMVANNAAALPTDPTASTCGAGCLIDVTPVGTSYTPPPGVLAVGVQYFWQVHARSPQQYGSWSTVSSFATGQSTIASLSISPSSNVPSGSYSTLTITLSGPAPSGGALVALSVNNLTAYPVPSSITVPAGAISESSTVEAGPASAPTTVLVTGTYGGTQTVSLTVSPNTSTITTGAANGITSYSAVLNGTVNPEGATGYAYFQYSTDSTFATSLCTSANATLTANTTVQAVSISTTGSYGSSCAALPSGTTYYFRTAFYNGSNSQTIYGPVQSFTTLATPVTTGAANPITSYSAILNGTVNPEGATGYAYFQYSTDSTFATSLCTSANATLTANTTVQAVSISTTGSYGSSCAALPSGTTYYFRTAFYNGSNSQTIYGPVEHFKTLLASPTVAVTPSAPSITTTQALTVTVTVSGGSGNPTPTGSVVLSGGGYTSAATVLSSGSATISIPANSLSAGTDNLTAAYTPDSSSSSTFNSASGSAGVTVTRVMPTVTVTPSASSITTVQALTVTVSVAGTPTPTGTVVLSGGGYTSAATVLSSGSATINIPAGALATGTDMLTVNYTPDTSSSSTYSSASGSATLAVGKLTPAVTVTSSAPSITTAQGLTVTVLVSGGSGNLTPTGSGVLSGGGYTSAATVLSSGSATISIPANSLSAGTDNLTAAYTPDSSSSSTFNSASGSTTVTVTTPAKITPTVGVTPSAPSITTTQALTVTVTVSGGSGNPTPTGSVVLSGGGYTSAATVLSSGSATINIPAGSLSVGTDVLTVNYTPDTSASTTYNSASGSASVSVVKMTATVVVTPSSSSITTTQALTVTVNVSGSPTPTGSVVLAGGGYTSAATVLSSGSATINIPANSLTAGTDTLTVSYTPDSSSSSIYNATTGSTTVTVTTPVVPASYSMSATSVTVTKGSSGTSTLTVSTTTGYAGTVSFTCKVTSSPANAVDPPSCSSSQTVTLSAGTTSGTASISVSTTAASTSALSWPRHGGSSGWEGAGGGAALAVLVVLWVPRRKRTWQSMLGVLVVCAVIGAVTGCGGGTSVGGSNPPPTTNPGTTSGTYTITVTGIGNDSANTTATATFTLTVN